MAKLTALFLFLFFEISLLKAQSGTDSTRIPDTVISQPATIDTAHDVPAVRKPIKKQIDSVLVFQTDSLRFSDIRPVDFNNLRVAREGLLASHPYFDFFGKPVHVRAERYEPVSYDGMFYLLVLMLFYFAIVKLFFSKYLGNLMILFFRASMRQQQLREQVLQAPVPSLLLNLLFVFSGGLYGAFLLRHYHYGAPQQFWFHFLFCAAFLAVLYLLKYLILRVAGWIFNIKKAVETYLFVVFMTNKIIGIFLLPFLLLISFAGSFMTEVIITLSIAMICLFYIYRFIAAYSTFRKEIKISGLYFFLYLCAFEIAPLLLIYKVLVTFLEKAY